MDTEFLILIGGLVLALSIFSFFIYRTMTFFFLRKVVTYILEPTGKDKYHVLKKIKKKLGTESVSFMEGIYPIDLKYSITDTNNSELLFYKKNTAVPLSFNSVEKNNPKLLKTMIKTKVWGQIFGGGMDSSSLLIALILAAIAILMIGYLIYANSQLMTQIQLLQLQLNNIYNQTQGGLIIG